MRSDGLILIGAGGHARACIDVVEQHGQYNIVGLVGQAGELGAEHFGYPVIATDDELSELARLHKYALIATGQIQTPDIRMRLYRRVAELGFELPLIVAPTAHVSRHAMVGAGTIVMHGAIVNAGARVGSNCIVNSRALLEHDVTVEDHCHISTGTIVNGNVRVGEGSFIGSGSVIKEGVVLGNRCVVGMGLAVRSSQGDGTQFLGRSRS
jgi:sugar O-acyltransferase (sialic acid O-acetyltransferase NeuD family)